MPTEEIVYVYDQKYNLVHQIEKGINWSKIAMDFGVDPIALRTKLDTRSVIYSIKMREHFYFKTQLITVEKPN